MLLFMGSLLGSLSSCARPQERVSRTALEKRASSTEIDRDPWALMPEGAIAWMKLDTQAFLSTAYGPAMLNILQQYLPLAGGARLNFTEDLESLSGAGYATVSLDWLLIAQGTFQIDAMEKAISLSPVTSSGEAIVEREYESQKIFVSGRVALSFLSNKTLAFGSETAVRRVIERVVEGRLAATTPRWFDELLKGQSQPFVAGLDLDSNPIPGVLKSELLLLEGLRAGRMWGNFAQPGLNVTGAFNYSKPQKATQAAEFLRQQQAQLRRYSLLARMMKIPQPLEALSAQENDRHLQMAVQLNGKSLEEILKRFEAEVNAYLRKNVVETERG